MSSLLDTVLSELAGWAWRGVQVVNGHIPAGDAPRPEWAPGPLKRVAEREHPDTRWPRHTRSLCPRCVIEARRELGRGERDLSSFVHGHVGEIEADIAVEDGRVVMRKTCARHGSFDDVLSIDPGWTRTVESRHGGADFGTACDEHVHRHGSSSIRYGRGAAMTIDITNRCNMMCGPCFMDANRVGYVHEMSLDTIKAILDASLTFKPRRQMSVQLSGGEPTLSPHWLEACRYAKQLGYYSVQIASNGLRFALEPDLAAAARDAGLDMVYFQLDGVTNESNSHRHVANLFDAKQRAIESLHAAGIDITPVTTVIRTVNDHQVGPLFDFVLDNCDKIGGISFQPIAFTGRDELVSDDDRHRRRYTISHLAHDLAAHTGHALDPYRDWYPLGAMDTFSALYDQVSSGSGASPHLGGLSCACHPSCGASVLVVANRKTKVWAPITRFFALDRFMEDLGTVCDSRRGKVATLAQVALSFLRHFDPAEAPPGLDLVELVKLFNGKMGGSILGYKKPEQEWTLVWIGGMWFQDLWTYDFRRTEMCAIPQGTEEGEISFCAYNTGVGWRQIVEPMHAAALTRDWFAEHGRHPIYAHDRPIDLPAVAKGRPTHLRVAPAPRTVVGGGDARDGGRTLPRRTAGTRGIRAGLRETDLD